MKKYRTVIILFVVALTAFGLYALGSDLEEERTHPFKLLGKVKVGSSVRELEILRNDRKIWASKVYLWIPASASGPGVIETPVGRYKRRDIGGYDLKTIGPKFTGRIHFFVERGFYDDVVLDFEFIDGFLRIKGWGIVPG